MLDTKKVGIKICTFRKKTGYSQEKLAEMLHISPQAVSKWENGHALPDTQMLPVLAQIFNCTIDEMIMPAYIFDEEIEAAVPSVLEQQAEHIAKIVIKQIGDNIVKNKSIGLDDQEIIDAVRKMHTGLNSFEIIKSTPEKNRNHTLLYITVKTPQVELKLAEKIYSGDDRELRNYGLFSESKLDVIPTVYYINADRRILLTEDLNSGYIRGNAVMNIVAGWDTNHEDGRIYQANLKSVLKSAAKFHAAFWENTDVFEVIGLNRSVETKENMLAHISSKEKAIKKYRKNYTPGAVWEHHTDNIADDKLDYFNRAIEYLKDEYVKYIDERFDAGKNITVINGELEPIQTYMSVSSDRAVKILPQNIRVGLCTENLAELLALHIEPDKKQAESLLKYYHECLSEKVRDYTYDTFIADYRISIAEYMLKPIGLANHGINDFPMRDRAARAFETFVLELE